MNALKAVERTDNKLVVENYIVLFGDEGQRDLEGDFFTKSTDFTSPQLQLNERLPMVWEHGFYKAEGEPGRDELLGFVDWTTAKTDETGIFVQRVLNRSNAYIRLLDENGLFDAGIMGSSSEGDANFGTKSKNGAIKRWPLIGDALTVAPIEHRMITDKNTIQKIKALSDKFPGLKSLIPEDNSLAAANPELKDLLPEIDPKVDSEANDGTGADEIETQGDSKMSEEKEAQAAPAVDRTDDILSAIKGIGEKVEAVDEGLKAVNDRVAVIEAQPKEDKAGIQSPAVLKHEPGDSFAKSFKAWVQTEDPGTFDNGVIRNNRLTIKASNDTDMNIGTDADGGYAVPTGHFDQIIARRDQAGITPRLGLRNIVGVGTTVNVPLDNEADGEFVSTAEAGTFDRDAPALGTVAMTLVKYTKKIQLSYELMQDEASNIMGFLENWVGRGYAKTLDQLVLAEVASDGTEWDEFASATVIAVGEPENLVSNADLGGYLDDNDSVSFVMNHQVYWEIKSLRSANFNNYSNYPSMESHAGPELLGFPVHKSMKSGATAASTVSAYFGNWFYVGWRQSPSLTFLRNPYLLADSGQDVLHYYFRTDFEVLQAEAIGYGVHASA